jgi:WD40 repeat protein
MRVQWPTATHRGVVTFITLALTLAACGTPQAEQAASGPAISAIGGAAERQRATPTSHQASMAATPATPRASATSGDAGPTVQAPPWPGEFDWLRPLAFSPDGRWLAVAGSSGVTFYEAHTLQQARVLATSARVTSLAFAPDGATVAAGLEDTTVALWRVADGTPLHTLRNPQLFARSLAYSPDGAVLAVGYDRVIALWRTADGGLVRALTSAPGRVESLVFTRDGGTLIAAHIGVLNPHQVEPMTVRFWRVADGTEERALPGPGDFAVALTAAGPLLAMHTVGGALQVWPVTSDAPPRAMGHNPGEQSVDASVTELAFAPDGTTVVAGARDKAVRLWRVSDGALLRTFKGHTKVVIGVAVSPDGAWVASVSLDGALRLWHI